jgi:carbamate kinase
MEKKPRRTGVAVIAIGGNALAGSSAGLTWADQTRVAGPVAASLASLFERGWKIVVTHGNGPQVGETLRRTELMDPASAWPRTLDVAVAETQGSIGYLLSSAISLALAKRRLPGRVVVVMTRCVIRRDDPDLRTVTKPVGLWYSEAEARRLAAELGWTVAEDSGRGWRRFVASPKPVEVVESEAIATLLSAGYIVVAAGGGGIPIFDTGDAGGHGPDAVIDKDYASALLASHLGAELLVLTTQVAEVAIDFGKPTERRLSVLTTDKARELIAAGQFGVGSMAPKIDAACQFLENGGINAIITRPDLLDKALDGGAGTRLTRGRPDNSR